MVKYREYINKNTEEKKDNEEKICLRPDQLQKLLNSKPKKEKRSEKLKEYALISVLGFLIWAILTVIIWNIIV